MTLTPRLLLVAQDLRQLNRINFLSTLIRQLDRFAIPFSVFDLSIDLGRYGNRALRAAGAGLGELIDRGLNRRLFHQASRGYSHVVVIKGAYLFPEALTQLKRENPRLCLSCINTDDPFRLAPGSSNERIRDAVPFYDRYFTWSQRIVEKIDEKAGRPIGVFLPFAADTDVIQPLFGTRHRYPVSFVGNWDPERQETVDRIGALFAEKGMEKLRVFGLGWRGRGAYVVDERQIGPRFVDVLCRSAINLNLLRLQNKQATNLRTFEIPASGTFMLHEASEEAESFFRPAQEAEYFASAEELVDKVQFYLANAEARERIARAGYEKVYRGNTYRDRIVTLLRSLEIET